MARVQVQDAPTVAPSAAPPSDYNPTQASPSSFGGLTGQADQKLGGDLQQAGGNVDQTALLFQDRYNQVATDDSFNKFQTGLSLLTWGDPKDPSSKGLYSLTGSDALRAGPGVMDKINTLREQTKASLQNDAQRLQFDEQSRRLVQYTSGEISRHLLAQSTEYATSVNTATAANAGQHAANAWNSDEAFLHSQADSRVSYVKNAMLKAGDNPDPAILEQALRAADTHVAQSRFQGAFAQDPAAAADFLKNGTMLGHDGEMQPVSQVIDPAVYDQMLAKSKTAATAADVNKDISETLGLPRGGVPAGLVDRIIGPESGGIGDAQNPRSSAGGLGQSIDSTWLGTVKQHAPQVAAGKSDAEILAMKKDTSSQGMAFQRQMTTALTGDNASALAAAGVPVTAGNVYAAHFFGPDGAVKVINATPDTPMAALVSPAVMAANPQLRGQTAGQLMASLNSKMAGAPAPSADATVQLASVLPGANPQNTAKPLPDYETAVNTLRAKWSDNPQKMQIGMIQLNKLYATQVKAQKDTYEAAASGLVQKMIANPLGVDADRDIGQNPAFNVEQKMTMFGFLNKSIADYNTNHGQPDAKMYGVGWNGVLKAVTAPPSDPGRITDPNVLWKMAASGDLTVAGVKQGIQIIDGRGTPEGESMNTLQSTFFKAAHAELSGEGGILPGKDPKGERLFQAYQVQAFANIEAARKAGIPAGQMFDEKSPNYVGRGINIVKRTPGERMLDMASANGGGTDAMAPPKPAGWISSFFSGGSPGPDLSTVPNIQAALSSGKINYDQAAAAIKAMPRAKVFPQAAPGALPMAKTEGQP